MVPIQFEYEIPHSVYDYESDSYVDNRIKKFVVVLGMFRHHYTNELMYKIREDSLWPEGLATSREDIITESAILEMLKTQVTE